jgi:hypothetical protein
MNHRNPIAFVLFALLLAVLVAGCSRKMPTDPWVGDTNPVVFDGQYSTGVGFNPFLGTKVDAVVIDSTVKHLGMTSLKVTVPPPGDPSGGYAGGAFVSGMPRNLTSYNALSFWVKASRRVPLEVAGYGNDNTGTSKFEGKRMGFAIDTAWTQVFIPIPLASKLRFEKGMFFFAEAPQAGQGLTFWLTDIRFVNSTLVTNPRPALVTRTVNAFAGSRLSLASDTRTVFNVNGLDQTVIHMSNYFDFSSSNSAVATASGAQVDVVGTGTASITARLGGIAATGAVTVNGIALPATAAPAPAVPSADVISLFSNAYPNRYVDTWSAQWDFADVTDLSIAGNAAKGYVLTTYAGIEFTSQVIDASAMTHFHLDVWALAGTNFKVKLVDFGANGVYGGGDDSERELTFDATTTPAMTTGTWVPLEIPLASFTGLTSRGHLAQLIFAGDMRTLFVDNIYFHK